MMRPICLSRSMEIRYQSISAPATLFFLAIRRDQSFITQPPAVFAAGRGNRYTTPFFTNSRDRIDFHVQRRGRSNFPRGRLPMLKLMRDSFQQLKWILVAIVAIFILFIFVDWGAGGAGGRAGDDRSYVARVNGETISSREYERELVYMQKQYEQIYRQNLTPEAIQALGLGKQALDSLIDQ